MALIVKSKKEPKLLEILKNHTNKFWTAILKKAKLGLTEDST